VSSTYPVSKQYGDVGFTFCKTRSKQMLAYCKIQQMLYIVAAQLFINQTSTVFEIGTSFHGLYMHAQLICQSFGSSPSLWPGVAL